MSGVLQPDFRQGNRSEYLAQYLLTALGTAVYVPRQEDVGIDFNCAICHNNGKIDEVKEQFHVQIKSNLSDEIEYGSIIKSGKENKPKWKKHELDWLFNLDNPLFIGICDKTSSSLELYSTSFMWYNYYNKKFLTIKFLPNVPSGKYEEVHATDDIDISEWAGDINVNIPKVKTLVKMGPPIIKLDINTVQDEDQIFRIRKLMRQAILLEQGNINYKKLNLAYFLWPHAIATNEEIKPAYFYAPQSDLNNEQSLYQASAPILISLALLYKQTGDNRFSIIMDMLKLVPQEIIPQKVKKVLFPETLH